MSKEKLSPKPSVEKAAQKANPTPIRVGFQSPFLERVFTISLMIIIILLFALLAIQDVKDTKNEKLNEKIKTEEENLLIPWPGEKFNRHWEVM